MVDSATRQLIGTIRRSALGRFAAREWSVIDALGQELGTITRNADINLFVLHHHFSSNVGTHSIEIATESRNPFAPKISLDLSAIPAETLDRRLAVAFGLLVLVADSLR